MLARRFASMSVRASPKHWARKHRSATKMIHAIETVQRSCEKDSRHSREKRSKRWRKSSVVLVMNLRPRCSCSCAYSEAPPIQMLANTAKHFAFTRCGELNLYEMVDAQIAIVEGELLT